jgi:uncharacterized protein
MTSENGQLEARELLENSRFAHDVQRLELIETHISQVVLTGPFAYKIKKPVRFDFVDYSTLENRRGFCFREVELNRRFAPEIYLGVVALRKVNSAIEFGAECLNEAERLAESCPIEYAVKMRQFSQELIAATRLAQPDMSAAAVGQFGRDLAAVHRNAPHLPAERVPGFVDRFAHDVNDNFAVLGEAFANDSRGELLRRLEVWSRDQLQKNLPLLERRCSEGMIRLCHGDLHLRNIVVLDGRLVPFDGIEFNENLQWIDILNETAFAVMDFAARGRADLGWRLLDSWYSETGIDEGVSLLRLFLVYRALVRAKVTWLNPHNHPAANGDDRFKGTWDKYLSTAAGFAFDIAPRLAITHGVSGSGKSTRALDWIDRYGGLRIRSDVERMRLGEQTAARYSESSREAVYDRMLELAGGVIGAGLPVVIDATFLRVAERQRFRSLAASLGVPFEIIHCDAPFDELCRRIGQRKGDPSEATIEVLRRQLEDQDPLDAGERRLTWKGEPGS